MRAPEMRPGKDEGFVKNESLFLFMLALSVTIFGPLAVLSCVFFLVR
jgi:hypothetical protein